MTPSEKDLRDSLRHGEGDAIDADRIVAAGAAARSQRRNRVLGVAAAVVLVAGVGSLAGVLLPGHGQDRGDSGGGSAQADVRNGQAIASGEPAARSAASSTASTSSGVAPPGCPSTFPQRLLPGGGRPGVLFEHQAVSIRVCAYGSALQAPNPATLTLTGTRASELQRSLENASATARNLACPTTRGVDKQNLAFVAIDAAGKPMRLVTTTVTVPICDTRTTNGITVRFGWVPPLSVRQQLYALTPSALPSVPIGRISSGRVVGSPVR